MANIASSLSALQRDLAAVARDAEALLRATAEISNTEVQAVRDRTESSLRQAQRSLRRARWQQPLRNAYDFTSTYARRHPWATIAVIATLALLFGLSRSGHRD
jgi:ElaB/YqjD/DUF883 family membrane-anchored ribosome-binding protein